MTLGAMIRRSRKERKLTLKAVAEKAGVSEGFLSQVENDSKSPSVDTLLHICNAMSVNVGDVLNKLQNQERLFVIRRTEWDDVDLPHTGFATRRFVPPDDRSAIDGAILFLEPGRSIPVRKNIRNGQELLCVLRGSLELVRDRTRVELVEGDAAHVWADPNSQRITNIGDGLAVVFWVGTI